MWKGSAVYGNFPVSIANMFTPLKKLREKYRIVDELYLFFRRPASPSSFLQSPCLNWKLIGLCSKSIRGVGIRKKVRAPSGVRRGGGGEGWKMCPVYPVPPPLLPVFYDSFITTSEQILVLTHPFSSPKKRLHCNLSFQRFLYCIEAFWQLFQLWPRTSELPSTLFLLNIIAIWIIYLVCFLIDLLTWLKKCSDDNEKKNCFSPNQVKTSALTFIHVCFFKEVATYDREISKGGQAQSYYFPWQGKLLQVAEITVIKDHVVRLRAFKGLISILWQRCDDGTTPLHNLVWCQIRNNKVKENIIMRNRLRTYSTRPLQVRKVCDPRFLEQRMLVNHIESWEIPE